MTDNNNLQKRSLIWLDDSLDDSQDNIIAQNELRLLDNDLNVFKNTTDFKEYINSQTADAYITLVVNDKLGQQVVSEMQNLPQIVAIYVFCVEKEADTNWVTQNDKVKAVCTELDDLKKELESLKSVRKKRTIITELPLDDPIELIIMEVEARYEPDCLYMILDSCFDHLARMKMSPTAKDEYIALCRDALKDNKELMPVITEFSESYNADQAISWLTRGAFFCGCIDNIFRFTCVDAMYPCRVLIQDTQKQLEQHKCKSTVHVYYCETMSNDMFEQFKNYKGKIIAMKSFFWTNLDREVVLTYLTDKPSSNDFKCLLFTIKANPQTENAKPFAKLDFLGDENRANEVLFMIGSLFKITEIEDEKDGVVNIKMTLCANDNKNQLINQYISSNGETDDIGFGQLLVELGNLNKNIPLFATGEQIIRSCFEKLANDDPNRLRCYDVFGNIEFSKGDFDASLRWCKQSFEIRKQNLSENDPILVNSYRSMAVVHLGRKDYIEALKYFNQLLVILKKSHGDDNDILVFCYTNLAIIHEAEERISDALACHHLALSIIMKNSSNEDPRLAFIYHNLANVYTVCQHYHIALGYYNTSLEMKLKLCTPDHSSIALTHRNIGIVHQSLGNIPQSRENYKKAAIIYRQLYKAGESHLANVEELIESLPTEST